MPCRSSLARAWAAWSKIASYSDGMRSSQFMISRFASISLSATTSPASIAMRRFIPTVSFQVSDTLMTAFCSLCCPYCSPAASHLFIAASPAWMARFIVAMRWPTLTSSSIEDRTCHSSARARCSEDAAFRTSTIRFCSLRTRLASARSSMSRPALSASATAASSSGILRRSTAAASLLRITRTFWPRRSPGTLLLPPRHFGVPLRWGLGDRVLRCGVFAMTRYSGRPRLIVTGAAPPSHVVPYRMSAASWACSVVSNCTTP
mmetsp:Transcript_73441/g.207410  ORF Transcript_73441/g.207410 Transcript_73441/m.207410 type:complete len:262 (+) Transcript_73441:257-1042(+)